MLTWGFPAMRVQVGVPVIQGMEVGLRKLPDSEICMIIRSLVLTHYQRVTVARALE